MYCINTNARLNSWLLKLVFSATSRNARARAATSSVFVAEPNSVMLLDLANGVEREISPKTFFNIGNVKWLPNGDSLLVDAKESLDGRMRIWQVSIANGEARALTRDATDYASMSLDKAADKMIATNVSNTFHLYLAQAGDLNNPKALCAARTFSLAPRR